MGEVNISVAQCKNGNMTLTFDNEEGSTEITVSPIEMRKICMIILTACEQIDSCFYSPFIGHA